MSKLTGIPSKVRRHSSNLVVGLVLVFLIFVVSGCGAGSPGNIAVTSSALTNSINTTSSTTYPIKVYFSKYPESDSNFNAVFPVSRTSPTIQVGTFAIQMLIAGSTPEEWSQGYYSELNSLLTGPSNCSAPHPTGGPDFKLSLNKKGTVNETGTATLKFCRTISSPGIGADARVTAQINTTLKQFSSIKKVVILTKEGHCFGDQSGNDNCLK